jgi:hypothetical protein
VHHTELARLPSRLSGRQQDRHPSVGPSRQCREGRVRCRPKVHRLRRRRL